MGFEKRPQSLPCRRLLRRNLLRRPFAHDAPACGAALGSEVDHPVGVRNNVEVVFDDHDGAPGIDEAREHVHELRDVGHMEAHRRLIEHVERVRRPGGEVRDVAAAGADWIHFDVMDNHYVPNLTVGPLVLKAIRPHVTLPIDVHLMIEPVDALIPSFIDAGADIITFHCEATKHIDRSLQLIRNAGKKAGLVFNPATPLSYLDYELDRIDVVLLMSVNPGFGGQSFIESTIEKTMALREKLDAYKAETGREIALEIDGGVKPGNIARIAAAGADTFVAGSAVFGAGSPEGYAKVIRSMKEAVAALGDRS